MMRKNLQVQTPFSVSKIDDILEDDNHFFSNLETPIREGAFLEDSEVKIEKITSHFKEIMEILGLDLEDDSLKNSPKRVAKMFVNEIFYGLNPDNKPEATLFENKYKYRNMLIERNIQVQSTCEHHFLPIMGVAHIAYFSSGKVIGLSKLNRIVDYYSRRPQVQERLTLQIAQALKDILDTEDVAVMIDAKHLCVQARGIKHQNCSTISTEFGGKFLNENIRKEFFSSIAMSNQ